MKCPYCGAEMNKGYFHNDGQPVQWIPEGQKPSVWRGQLAKASVPLGQGSWLKGYRADCVTLGRDICVVQGDTIRYAKALDVDENGGLVIRLTDGSTETVSFGEVSVRGMYGYL